MKIPRAESKTVEFKAAFNQDAIVALVAFANADGGDVFDNCFHFAWFLMLKIDLPIRLLQLKLLEGDDTFD